MKDNSNLHDGILEKERWKPTLEKETLELNEPGLKSYLTS